MRHSCSRTLIILAALMSCMGAAKPAPRSDLADFLAVLRQRGYADFAAEYLEARKNDAALPADVRETWDVEMASCLWITASRITNDQEADKLRAKAQQHLDTFLKEHPSHPAVADAMLTWGTDSLDRGVYRLYLARTSTVDAEKEKHAKEARELLSNASSRLKKAVEVCEAAIGPKGAAAKDDNPAANPAADPPKDAPKKPAAAKAPVDAATAEWMGRLAEGKFASAVADYWYAQSCGEAEAEEKKTRLASAAKTFDEIYSQSRSDPAKEWQGHLAHYWQAKLKSEVGDQNAIDDALEICDEVLTITPDTIGKRSEVDPRVLSLAGDTMVLRMQLLAKSKQELTAIQEGASLLRNWAPVADMPAYQLIAIEWSKLMIAHPDVIEDPKQRNEQKRTLASMLSKYSIARGPYQREFVQLLNKMKKTAGTPGKPAGATFDEAFAAAESALIAEQWASAAAGYKRALELLPNAPKLSAADKRDKEEQTRERLAYAQFQVTIGLAGEEKWAEAADAAESLMTEAAKTTIGPRAAVLAMQLVQKLATDPKLDKSAQQVYVTRLEKLANTTLTTWPKHPVADEARFVLGQIYLMQNKVGPAIANLTSINPTSPKYSDAMLSAGKYARRRYKEEMAKPEKDRNPQVLEKTRSSALQWLTAGVASKRAVSSGDAKEDEEREKVRRQRAAEVKLMLAEVQMECNMPEEAMAHYQQLIEDGLKQGGDKLDDITMRALAAALRANITRGNMDKGSELAVELGKRAGDQPQINGLLVNVLKFLVRDVQKAEAAVIEAGGQVDRGAAEEAPAAADNTAARQAANQKLAAARKRTGNLLSVLADRKQVDALTMIYLGDNCIRVGLKTEGKALYQRILAEVERNPKFAPEEAVTRVQARLIQLLIDARQYAEALRQINMLLAKFPKALDVLVLKARVLQASAATDPKLYDEAIAQWTNIRTMLSGAPRKVPEYYEAISSVAECLLAKKDPASANQAEKLLKGTLVLNPQLNGPDTVAKYQRLIKRAEEAQGRTKAEAAQARSS